MLDDFREWLSDNLRYILLILAIALAAVIIICVVRLAGGRNRSETGTDTSSTAAVSTGSDSTGTASASSSSSQTSTEANAPASAASSSTTDSLVKDDAAVLTLIEKYYTAVAAKDETTLSQIVQPWNDTVRDNVLGSGIMESYNDLTTYSKKGLTDGSYVVYAYYNGKISGIDTQVPSLSLLYLVPGEDGSLLVSSDRESNEEINDYVTRVTSDADVQALISEVNQQFNAAVASDSDLAAYVNSRSDNTGTTGESSTETQETTGAVSSEVMTATAGLNIRSEPNTSSSILGTVIEGTSVTVLEDAGDGWVHISYESTAGTIEGYVMLQYLTSSGDSSQAGSSAASGTDSSSDDTPEAAPTSSDDVAA